MLRHSAWVFIVTFAGFLALAAGPARSASRLAISGYDPVAYFTDGKPVRGNGQFEYRWHGLRWQFASLAHRKMFAHDPERYAPQFDGYCAVGVAWSTPHKDTVDPTAWTIVAGKLYLTHNHHWLGVWRAHTAEYIARGDANWPRVRKETVLYDGWPHLLKTNGSPAAGPAHATAAHGS
jgi:YHS domain-containing protein